MHCAALGVPALQGKPLCVSHSASKQGAGEVSSANYEARAFGVRAVMTIGEARRLCPNLIVMPYEFDKYEDISDKVGSCEPQIYGRHQQASHSPFTILVGTSRPLIQNCSIRSRIRAIANGPSQVLAPSGTFMSKQARKSAG